MALDSLAQTSNFLDLTLVDKSLSDITDSSQLNHGADSVTLDSLVLGDAAGAVGAADGLDVATTVLVASVISSLEGLFVEKTTIKGEYSVDGWTSFFFL